MGDTQSSDLQTSHTKFFDGIDEKKRLEYQYPDYAKGGKTMDDKVSDKIRHCVKKASSRPSRSDCVINA